MKKKILLYCHDTLAFGHISRMLNIYEVLSRSHEVCMIFGGTVPLKYLEGKNYIGLPLLDERSISLKGKDNIKVLYERQTRVTKIAKDYKADVLLIDYFPFGRKALKGEIESFIHQVREENTGAKIYTFMRDICHAHTEFIDRAEYEWLKTSIYDFFGYPYTYMIENHYDIFHLYSQEGTYQQKEFLRFINKYFISPIFWEHIFSEYYFENDIIDECLIFGDVLVHDLRTEFNFSLKVERKFHHLGYLLPQGRSTISPQQKKDNPYILVSFGGAIFDCEIYKQVLQKISSHGNILIKCIVPFFKESEKFGEIQKSFQQKNIEFIPFGVDFYILHHGAMACIMGGGYGSFMDLLEHPIPTLVVLNHSEEVMVNKTEQYQRYMLFQSSLPILLYHDAMTGEEILLFLQKKHLEKERKVDTKGAEKLESFFK